MNLDYQDNPKKQERLLVQMHKTHELYDLAKSKNPADRTALITTISGILSHSTTPREEELIADLLIDLIKQAETDLRQALAEKLSIMENVPFRLILNLANDEIEVAAPVLTNSVALKAFDLIYIIKAKTPEYWQVIATRKNLDKEVINTLADTRDFGTAVALAKNANITITEYALTILSDLAQTSETLAQPLLRREEITKELAARLYNYVGEELKKFIVQNYDLPPAQEKKVVSKIDDLVFEFGSSDPQDEIHPTDDMLSDARALKKKGLLNTKTILATLKRGQFNSFIAGLSVYTDLPPGTIIEAVRLEHGKKLAILCKTFDITKQDFISLFLLTNRLRNHKQTTDLSEITRAISFYDSAKPDPSLRK